MAAQTLSEIEFYQWMNESLVKLESQLQTLFNEFRSFRSAWEAQSPTLPPPVSATAPRVLSSASATSPAPSAPIRSFMSSSSSFVAEVQKGENEPTDYGSKNQALESYEILHSIVGEAKNGVCYKG
ncbi:hypothetical protein HanIR_Chr05g0214421 [Helianthus annuus]|nr:hypothetical protein HanIR_Chr05g0214421 [Helianthus annuus]